MTPNLRIDQMFLMLTTEYNFPDDYVYQIYELEYLTILSCYTGFALELQNYNSSSKRCDRVIRTRFNYSY